MDLPKTPVVKTAAERFPDIMMQPPSRPISQEQLIKEVRTIYAGLTMVESKCIEVCDSQSQKLLTDSSSMDSILSHSTCNTLISLHRRLLHEHYDFLLATQHPSATPALKNLVTKYSMPNRAFKYGIHQLLELFRKGLPHTHEFMMSFTIQAYQMLALIYETVPVLQHTWMEDLGDVSRYRMVLEDENNGERNIWACVARSWYTKALDLAPQNGRLMHHLAILAPDNLSHLSLMCQSLISEAPFFTSRDSMLAWRESHSTLKDTRAFSSKQQQAFLEFVKVHCSLLTKDTSASREHSRLFLSSLEGIINERDLKWAEEGAKIAISNITALFDYGLNESLRSSFENGTDSVLLHTSHDAKTSLSRWKKTRTPGLPELSGTDTFHEACDLFQKVLKVILVNSASNSPLSLSYLNATLIFITRLAEIQAFEGITLMEGTFDLNAIIKGIPMDLLCQYLNTLPLPSFTSLGLDYNALLITHGTDLVRAVPEDRLMRGLVWSKSCFSANWFDNMDEEESCLSSPPTMNIRQERLFRLGLRLAEVSKLKRPYLPKANPP
jgi:hypothetical protein